MARAVALLRGINVGGRNIIRMAELRACFERHGFDDVATYIQSGNVVFGTGGPEDRAGSLDNAALDSPARDSGALTTTIEALLAETFGTQIPVVVVDDRRMREIVDAAPDGFGDQPAVYRDDVIFLKPPLTADEAIAQVPVREGVDTAHPGPGALYFSRLDAKASQSRLSRMTGLPIYQRVTIRNWKTTNTLLEMLER